MLSPALTIPTTPTVRIARSHSPKPKLNIPVREISESLERRDIPPLLTLQDAAGHVGLRPSTLKRHVSEGKYEGSVRHGRPLMFYSDRFFKTFLQS